jgi:uncharacterized OB-fold protein
VSPADPSPTVSTATASGARGASGALTVKAFFEGVRLGRLVVQRCLGCRALAVPPKAVCPASEATTWEPAPLEGDGQVVSFTVIRVPPGRLAAEAPYPIVVVRMTEGVSLLGRMVDTPLDAIRVGLAVRVRPPTDPAADPPIVTFRPG